LQRMWAPWRIGYITGDRPEGCVFCVKIQSDEDEENHVLHRGEHNAILLNTYPYNSGHLMVVPNAHVGELTDLSPEAGCELWDLTTLAVRALKHEMYPQGVNIGMNLSLLPVIGIPLPFISAGGSSLITLLIAEGLVQSVVMRHKKIGF